MDLEAEIKDGIRQLALRLHCLYQHRKRTTDKSSSASRVTLQSGPNVATATMVNITITAEGKCEITTTESSSEVSRASDSRPVSFQVRTRQISHPALKNTRNVRDHARNTQMPRQKKHNDVSSKHIRNFVWRY